MGQMEFRADLSPDEEPNPAFTRYAAAAGPADAVQAVQRISRRREELDAALYLVRLQAVQALAAQGMSARDIAALDIGMSKSAVGRLMRDPSAAVAPGLHSDIRDVVADAWAGTAVNPSR